MNKESSPSHTLATCDQPTPLTLTRNTPDWLANNAHLIIERESKYSWMAVLGN